MTHAPAPAPLTCRMPSPPSPMALALPLQHSILRPCSRNVPIHSSYPQQRAAQRAFFVSAHVSRCNNSMSTPRRMAAGAAGLLATTAQQVLVSLPALADEQPAATSDAAATAGDAATAAGDAALTMFDKDPVTTVLFTFAVGALSIVTLGAAYLAISGFLADRKEKNDREEFEKSQAARAISEDRAKLQASRKVPRRKSSGGGQGFGP